MRHILTGWNEGPQQNTGKLSTTLDWGVNSLTLLLSPFDSWGRLVSPCSALESSLPRRFFIVTVSVFSVYLFGPNCLGLSLGWRFADRFFWVENTLLRSALKWWHNPPQTSTTESEAVSGKYLEDFEGADILEKDAASTEECSVGRSGST